MGSREPAYATIELGVRYSGALFDHREILRLNVINVAGRPGANTACSGKPRTALASTEFVL